jgi:ribonuclease VapC
MMEPGFKEILDKLASSQTTGIGIPTQVETAIVLSARLRRDSRPILSRFLEEASIVLVPFGEPHYATAVEAWLRYGKGRHRANLNFGDCISYAVAKLADESLLFTGSDFAKTDIKIA